MNPADIDAPTAKAFVAVELATHAPNYIEKLRAAFRKWNELANTGHAVPHLPLPGAPVFRQTEVNWASVPEGIRRPLDDLLETAVSVRNPGDWDDLVPVDDAEYADLGLCFQDAEPSIEAKGALILERLASELARCLQARVACCKRRFAGPTKADCHR